MRVLVTGGREFSDAKVIHDLLSMVHKETPLTTLIHGNAKGVDRICGEWAEDNGIEVISCPANWKRHGRAAGMIRNQQMLKDHTPDLLVAFPGGPGTANMIERARLAGIQIRYLEN